MSQKLASAPRLRSSGCINSGLRRLDRDHAWALNRAQSATHRAQHTRRALYSLVTDSSLVTCRGNPGTVTHVASPSASSLLCASGASGRARTRRRPTCTLYSLGVGSRGVLSAHSGRQRAGGRETRETRHERTREQTGVGTREKGTGLGTISGLYDPGTYNTI